MATASGRDSGKLQAAEKLEEEAKKWSVCIIIIHIYYLSL